MGLDDQLKLVLFRVLKSDNLFVALSYLTMSI